MQSPTIDSVALEFLSEIKEDSNRIGAQISLQRICVLGNHDEHEKEMEEIAKRLCADCYPATIIKKIPDDNNKPVPDFHKEMAVLKKAEIIVIIDNSKGGVVSECAFLMQNPEIALNTILMVHGSKTPGEVLGVTGHYVYFPNKVPYSDQNLVEITVLAAKQASYRLALKKLEAG